MDLRIDGKDLNNLPSYNIFTSVDNGCSNVPTDLSYGHLIHFAYKLGNTDYVVQIVVSYNLSDMWIRNKWGSSWQSWKAISLI